MDVVSCGKYFTLCCENGLVYGFGRNNMFQLANLRCNDYINKPSIIKDLKHIRLLSSGLNHSICIDYNDNIWTFGDNSYGQLGIGDKKENEKPSLLHSLAEINLAVCCDNTSFFLDFNGYIWYCGDILGNFNDDYVYIPKKITTIKDIVNMSAGNDHLICIDSNYNLWGLGNNNFGQLGIPTSNVKKELTSIQQFSKISKISCGKFYTLCLDIYGNIWSFGKNDYGQLGIGNNRLQFTPIMIVYTSTFIDINAGDLTSFFIDDKHNLYGCGNNRDIKYTDSTKVSSNILIHCMESVTHVIQGSLHAFIKCEDGTVFCFGNNTYGQLGLGDNITQNEPRTHTSSTAFWCVNKSYAKSARK